MQIAITGGTGFIGRYIVSGLVQGGHHCRCWYRPESDRSGFDRLAAQITWVQGELGDEAASHALLEGCDAVVHAGLHRAGPTFRGGEGDMAEFVQKNVVGTIQLIEAARAVPVDRFVFLSTCAVHEIILDDRPLDEKHPPWPRSHYGAHKAAIEMFVHSYGFGREFPICALRPCGVYGLNHPSTKSKWYDLVARVARGEDVECDRGGKEVHVADVAQAVEILLTAEGVTGEAYNCCDLYVSQLEIATIAKELTGSVSTIAGLQTSPKHEIETGKLRALGMQFGGGERLRESIGQLVEAVAAKDS